jgi:signal peptidase I
MRRLSRLQNNLLTVGAILGALCLLAALVVVLVGAKPLVFRSGSMAPAIPTGALGISIPVEAASIRTGDIISVETATGVRITHRVVSAEISGDTATVILKGDANSIPDAAPYVLQKADRVVAHTPLLGYAVAWLSSSAAVFAGGLFTAYLLYLAFGARGRRRSRPEPSQADPTGSEAQQDEDRPTGGHRAERRGRRATRLTAMSVASLTLLAGAALHSASPSQAAFTDTGSGTAQFAATTLAAPTLTCQNSGSYNVTFTLTHPGDFGTIYELRTLVPARLWDSGSWPGSPVSVTIDADHSAFNFNQSTDVEFRASSKFGSWVSAPALKSVRYTPETSILFVGLVPAKLRCL